MTTADTLATRVARWARTRPDDPAFTELRYRGTECAPVTVSYARLHGAAALSAQLLRRESAPGDRVAILCGHGLDYVVAFLACLYSGRIAVPLFPVTGSRNTARLDDVLADAKPTVGLVSATDTVTCPALGAAAGRLVRVPSAIATSTELSDPTIDPPADIAYLQYTSGSTKTPAGVRITHANLSAAMDQLRDAVPATRHKPIVSWLPFFHDMGLVLALALPLYSGVHGVTLAPLDFVKRPIRWLRACHEYRAGTTGSPNFGLSLAISGTSERERAGLDLSELDVLVNGAEPVRAEVLSEFTRTFAEYGFRHRAHAPGYGLAEATLSVSIVDQNREPVAPRFDRAALAEGRAEPQAGDAPPESGLTLVGCGAPVGQRVAIVEPLSRVERDDGEIGEIWVSGANVGAGYHGKPEATADVFGATLVGGTERSLRTGDLGFRHDGQLYIVGRLKDLIVVDGRNHYPSDIEATAGAAAPEVRTGHITAFGHDDGDREDLVIVAELNTAELPPSTDPVAVARRIRTTVAAVHEVMAGTVLLVEPGRIPKTSSGKIRRGDCRALFGAGRLPSLAVVGRQPPR
ncbi:fatty acyl-AMP ligase [Nocardia sp. NBC_01377]|uniref:fatty acyl-AMP ligase n=1 Tax=Nocardia sp. NBC_01377 TaxID=2903595 RepID=UPI0032557B37